jgi:hypothetical protein
MYAIYKDYDSTPCWLPLDPIEVKEFNMPRMRTAFGLLSDTVPFAARALSIIQDADVFRRSVLATPCMAVTSLTGRAIERRYDAEHIPKLVDWGIAGQVNESEVLCMSGYFAVEKNETYSRAIFNGIPVSAICRGPPAVHLSDGAAAVTHFRQLRGRVWFATLDLRHWFHQFALGAQVRPYFGLRSPSLGPLVWRRLPMGWSWSPWVAQATAWGVIIDALKNLGHDLKYDGALPYYIELRGSIIGTTSNPDVEPVIRIFLTYDNVALIGNTPHVEILHQAILKRFAFFGVEVKENFVAGPKQMDLAYQEKNGQYATHLGVHYFTRCGAKFVRTAEKTSRRWSLFASEIKDRSDLTRREVARLAGIIIADHRVRLLPLCQISEVTRALSENSKGDFDWNDVSPVDSSGLRAKLSHVCENLPTVLRRTPAPLSTTLLAVDASGSKAGYWAIDADGNTVAHGSVDLDPKLHIFTKELIAAKIGIAAVLAARGKNCHIILLEDNVAAAISLRKRYTSSQRGSSIVSSIDQMLMNEQGGGHTLTVFGVPSAFNPADEASRGKPSRFEKWVRFMHLFENEDAVPDLERTSAPFSTKGDRRRHTESDDESDIDEIDRWNWYESNSIELETTV